MNVPPNGYLNSQIKLKADKTYTDSLFAGVNASPKGVYATSAALAAAIPAGNSNIYIVEADGKWYYWNGSAWTAGSVYQNTAGLESKFGIYVGLSYINFNITAHTVTIPQYGRVVSAKATYGTVGAGGVTLTLNDVNIWAIGVNKTTNTWFAKLSTDFGTLAHDDIIVGTYWGGYCWCVGGNFTVNNLTQLASNSVVEAKIAANAITNTKIATGALSVTKFNADVPVQEFSESLNRLLIAPNMFFAKGVTLPVYKSSIVSISSRFNLNSLETFVNYVKADGTPKYKHFVEDIEIDGADLPSTLTVAMQSNITNAWYSQAVNVNYADPATKTQVPKIVMIGDSLTNRYIPKYTKDKLTALGISSNFQGTMANEGGENGEGRESWCWAHYIGRDSSVGMTEGEYPVLPLLAGTTSTLMQNPFVKVATTQDKTDNPTWCFRNTGKFNELNYSTDPIKTGNFYIFDFDAYITNHGIAEPDLVTIALGTNDINKAPTVYNITGLASCRLGLEIMVKKIMAARPSVKIAIIPAPVWGDSRWDVAVAEWIENCIKDVASFAFANVTVLPVWQHMSRAFIWTNTSVALNSTTNEKKNTNTDVIHFSTPGRHQYSNVTSSWIINKLT